MANFIRLSCICVVLCLVRLAFGRNCTIDNNNFHEFDVWNCGELFSGKIGPPEAGLACYAQEKRPARQYDIIRFSNTSRWADMCSLWNYTVDCVMRKFSGCSLAGAMNLLEDRKVFLDTNMEGVRIDGLTIAPIYHFGKRVCLNGMIRPEINELKDSDHNCFSREDEVRFMKCYERLDCEIRILGFTLLNNNPGIIDIIEQLSAGSLRCLRDTINNALCDQKTKRYLWLLAVLQMPSAVQIENLNVNKKAVVDFESEERCTVGAYGDPHLLYCNSDAFVTCHARGEQIYLSNPFMEVRGVNDEIPARLHPNPTVIRQISIKFKSPDGYNDVTTYIGQSSTLPKTFFNGMTTAGQGYDTVIIKPAGDNQVVFFQRAMGIIMSLRMSGGNYFFTIRMSTSVAKESHGLLASGCPPTDVIERDGLLPDFRGGPSRRRRRQEQDLLCRSGLWCPRMRREASDLQCSSGCAPLDDDNMAEICNFDCGITRDLAFVRMAIDGKTDLVEVKTHDTALRLSASEYALSKVTTPQRTTPGSTKEMTTSGSLRIGPTAALFLITHIAFMMY